MTFWKWEYNPQKYSWMGDSRICKANVFFSMSDLVFLFWILISIKYPFYIDKKFGPTHGRRKVFIYFFMMSELYLFVYSNMLVLQVMYDKRLFTYWENWYLSLLILGGMFIWVTLIKLMSCWLLRTSKQYLLWSFLWSSFVVLLSLLLVGGIVLFW